MPWRLSRDLRRFKQLTMGGTLIMGRKTFDSIGRPLPGRETIVVTRDEQWSADGVLRAGSPEQAVGLADPEKRAFVVGGAEIYRQLLSECTEVYLTRVWSQVKGDTVLEIDLSNFETASITRYPSSENDQVPTEFLHLIRSRSAKEG